MIRKHFHDVYFDGKSLADFGVHVSGDSVFSAPERVYNTVEVPGRNGSLHIDEGRFKSITLKYPAFIADDFTFNMASFRNFMLSRVGEKRLEDTYHPDEFRLARWAGEFTADTVDDLLSGEFELSFDCYPQRFLKSGEKQLEFTAAGSINNPYLQTAKPLIRAYGTGSFSVGGVTIQITSASSYTDIDCDLQECYKDSLATNCNSNVVLTSGNFPELSPGANAVTISGSITKLIITPRYWIL